MSNQTPTRNSNGHWLPGASGNPKGRPTKAQELAVLNAITSTFTPEQVQEYLQKAMKLAEEQNSARAMIAILEFCANYTIGKPTQRFENASNGLDEIIAKLSVMGNGENG